MEITRGITGIWQITQNKNVSNAVPLKIRFYIPPTAYGMHHLPLSYSVQDFETYSAVTSGGSSHTHDVTIPAHGHTTTLWDFNNALDSFDIVAQVRASTLSLSVPAEYPAGTSLDIGTSTKSETVPTSTSDTTHTHSISANLGTVSADCNDIAVSVDGVDKTAELEAIHGTLPVTDASDLDLFEYLSSPVLNAWHEVIITPNGVGSPAGMCYMYAYLSPETVVKQV